VPRGAGGGQERSRTRKRKCIESESHLHVCGLATINISHSGAVCEITKLAGPATHFPYLVRIRIRIGRSVGRRDSLTLACFYIYVCICEHPASLSANVCSSAGTQSVTFTKINYVRYGVCLPRMLYVCSCRHAKLFSDE
jgi:hypothetical protein